VSVDVVVVTHQSRPTLQAALDLLPAEARVVVVDNASSDGTLDVASPVAAQLVRNAENRGFAAAANQAAKLGRAEVLVFLNPDARIDKESLDMLVAELDSFPRVAVAGPRLVGIDGAPQRAWWPFPSPLATWVEALGLHRLRRRTEGRHGEVPFVVGACMAVRRRAFEELGGFDERFWLYGEEADLCQRAWLRGWQVHFVAGATATHVGGASAADAPALAFEHFSRGAELFILKHHGRAALLIHRLGLLVGSLLRLPLLALQRREDSQHRLATRRATTRRLVRVLATTPLRVPDLGGAEEPR